MNIVLDASAAIHAATEDTFSDMILDVVEQAESILAPELYYAEVSSGLLKHVKAGHLSTAAAIDKFEQVTKLVTDFRPLSELSHQAIHEAHRLGHSVYDMYYLVLARNCGAHLVSLDKRLLALARQENFRYIQFEEIDWDWE